MSLSENGDIVHQRNVIHKHGLDPCLLALKMSACSNSNFSSLALKPNVDKSLVQHSYIDTAAAGSKVRVPDSYTGMPGMPLAAGAKDGFILTTTRELLQTATT